MGREITRRTQHLIVIAEVPSCRLSLVEACLPSQATAHSIHTICCNAMPILANQAVPQRGAMGLAVILSLLLNRATHLADLHAAETANECLSAGRLEMTVHCSYKEKATAEIGLDQLITHSGSHIVFDS